MSSGRRSTRSSTGGETTTVTTVTATGNSTTTTGNTTTATPPDGMTAGNTSNGQQLVVAATQEITVGRQFKQVTTIDSDQLKSLMHTLEHLAANKQYKKAIDCFQGDCVRGIGAQLKEVQKDMQLGLCKSISGQDLKTENAKQWKTWDALDCVRLLRIAYPTKTTAGISVNPEQALKKFVFVFDINNKNKTLHEQITEQTCTVAGIIADINAKISTSDPKRDETLQATVEQMLENIETTSTSAVTVYICGEIKKRVKELNFQDDNFPEIVLEASKDIRDAFTLLGQLVTFREIRVNSNNGADTAQFTKKRQQPQQATPGTDKRQRPQEQDEEHKLPEGECYVCGRIHKGNCNLRLHPDANRDHPNMRWRFSPGGLRWKGKSYKGRLNPTELPPDEDSEGNRFSRPPKPSSGESKLIVYQTVNTTIESSASYANVLKPSLIQMFSNRGETLKESTEIKLLLDTGALDGNYIGNHVVDRLLLLNKRKLNTVINHHYELIRITTINQKLRALTTRGSVTLLVEMLNERQEALSFSIEAHVIPTTFDVIIGLPTIRKFNLLMGHFPSLITASNNNISDTSQVAGRDNLFRASAPGLINPDAPNSPMMNDRSDIIHNHHVNVIKQLVRTKEDLLGIEREPVSDLINDEYNISDMMKAMHISNTQGISDEAILDMITFCDDNPQLAQKLRQLCRKYIKIFRTGLNPEPANVPPMTISVDIEKWETEANRGAPRLQGLARAEEIRRQIEEMLRAGVIRQSNSPYYSQVLLTLKPNGEWRFVIDFRRLNNATIKQTWPLPNIKELMRRVGQHRPKRFAKIDFTKGYWQTPLDASSRRFTAFITSFGIFEWLRVPMGACGAAGYFQWVITTVVLVGLIYSICEVYLDDILVYGRTDEEFLERLELTFQRFEQRNVSISPPKCFLGLQSVEYVGHVVDENGLRMSTSKINKVIDFKKPRTQKEMKSFLGLANYFRDHIRNYASITKPLQDMIRKYKRTTILEYTPQTEQAFIDVKEAISNCSTLHFMDSQAPIFLHTDASKYAIGAYLFQVIDMKEVPIAFLSHLLSDSEVRWSTYEKEAYAIYYAFTELRYLIRDVKFTLRTDHANLVHIRNTGSEKVIRWKLAIQEYDFVVEHIAGEKNIVADALSRIIEIPESTLEKGGDLVDTEGEATHIVLTTEHRPAMLSIPPDIYRKISSVHNTTTGHHGVERTMMKLAMMNFQADKLRTFVKEFIRRCPCCQKMSQLKPIIHTLPFTTATAQPMQRLNFDTMGPFPIQEGYEYILVIVDSFTRFTELYPMKSVTAKEAALKLLSHIGRYGCPEELLTDGGHEFANATLQELATLMGTEQLITTPYSKEENGIVERTNKEVLRFLQQIVLVRYMQDRWVDYLPLVQRILNASVHKAIGTTPASLVFGNQIQLDRNIIVPFDHNTNPSRKLSDYVKDMMRAQAHLLHMALQIQEEQNFRHITSRDDRPTEFEPNSYVLVQYPITRMGRKQPTKLHTPWRGPLRVISHIGPKYTLQNLVTGKNEDMHISCLKTFVYDPTNVNPYEIALQDSGDRLLQTVLNHRGHTRRVHTLEFLVRYYSDNPNNIVEQWEPYHKIVNNVVLHQYLQLHGMKNLIPKNHRTGNMEALL